MPDQSPDQRLRGLFGDIKVNVACTQPLDQTPGLVQQLLEDYGLLNVARQVMGTVNEGALKDLSLPIDYLTRISRPLSDCGYALDLQPKTTVRDMRNYPITHHRLNVKVNEEECYIALLYMGKGLLADSAFCDPVLGKLLPFQRAAGYVGVTVFCDSQTVDGAYRKMAESLQTPSLKKVTLISLLEIQDFDNENANQRCRLIRQWLLDDNFEPEITATSGKKSIEDLKNEGDALHIVAEVFASQADSDDNYFERLISFTNWPKKWQETRKRKAKEEADHTLIAHNLLTYAVNQGTIPGTTESPSCLAIWDLFRAAWGDLGLEDRKLLDEIITTYDLGRILQQDTTS